ncbi:MAG: methyltransferase [Planctomycetes bacterium]|nr:methyltransferase [Planctomycetota bacterium]
MSFSPRPWRDYDHAPFAGLPEESWSEDLYLDNELIEASVTQRCLELLRELGAPVPGHLELLTDDLALGAGVPDDRAAAYHWLWRRLACEGRVVGDVAEEVTDVLAPELDPASLAAACAQRGERLGPTLALIEHVAAHYPAWLRGEVEGRQVLFSREGAALWEAFFDNANPVTRAVNALGAAVVAREVSGELEQVLEVGGGCGGGAELLLAALGERARRYRFTDVAPVLLSRGRKRLRARCPAREVEAGLLDLDRPLGEQGVAPASLDLIYAVNTLHAVADLPASLGELYRALRPGGTLALVESLPPGGAASVGLEFVFQLAPGFLEVRDAVRPHGGFLPWSAWRPALEAAGFRAACVPEPDAATAAYPRFAVGVLLGRKDA